MLLMLFGQVLFSQQVFTETIPGTSVSFKLALIPGSVFTMGSPESDPDRKPNESPQRQVRLDSFWMGVHEVTYDEFILFQQRTNDSDSTRHPSGAFSADATTRPTPPYIDFSYGMGKQGGFPMVSMTQQAALRYCQWLYKKTGKFYRLPTEAEWEFACRAVGSQQSAVGGEAVGSYAWLYENSFEKFHETGKKLPNAFGLHDMQGNVAEWTLDFYNENYLLNLGDSLAVNPWVQPLKRHSRTVRGGSYDSNAADCRCTARLKSDPKWQARDPQIPKSKWWNPDSQFVGFRLVRPVKPMNPEEVELFFQKAIKD